MATIEERLDALRKRGYASHPMDGTGATSRGTSTTSTSGTSNSSSSKSINERLAALRERGLDHYDMRGTGQSSTRAASPSLAAAGTAGLLSGMASRADNSSQSDNNVLSYSQLELLKTEAAEKLRQAKDDYREVSRGWGAASMQSKGGWVGNYLNKKATGKDATQFDWQTFSTAIEDKNRAEKEIAALDAAISQFALDDYITQNYGSMDNNAALAMSEAELQKARDEYYRLKRGSTIGAKSNKFTTTDQREQLAAAEEKYQRAKDVNTYFKDAVWWENADIDREKLEKTAQQDPSYAEKVSDATKAFAQLSGGIFDTQMTAKELATLTVLQSTDADAAKRYQEIIDYDINKRRYQAHKENLAEAGGFANLLAYYGSTAAAPLATLDNAWRGLKEWITGEYKPVDYYSEAYIGPQTREISSSNLLDNIESPSLQMLAELGLSAGQFVLAALTSKGIGSAFGANAGKAASFAYYNTDITANSMYSALKSGASRAEAAAIGIGDGLAEAAAEMLPLNRLLKVYDQYKAAGKFFSRETIKQILAQGGIEGSEELVTSYLNTLNNMLIMGERSDFNKAISEYMQYGLSAEEAYDAAITDFFITEPLISFGGGALFGGVLGAGGTALGSYRHHRAEVVKQRIIEEYQVNNKSAQQTPDANAPGIHVQDENAGTDNLNIAQGQGGINSEQGQGGRRDGNAAEDIADDALVLPTVNTPAMSGAEYKQRQEEQNRAANMTSAAEAADGQQQPITQADIGRANQLMEREMAAEQAEEEALSPDNFLTGELAERAAGGIIGGTTDSADTGYDIGEEIGDVGFGEGAVDNLPEQDLAERFRNKQQSGQTVTAPNESAKLKMLRNQLRNKGIRDVRVEDLPDGERGYYDPVTNEIVVSSKLTDEEAFNFAMGHEVVHHAVRADEDLVDDVISSMRADGIDVDARIAAVIARYRRHAAARGEDPSRIDERYAMEEVVADYIGEICRNDRYLQQLASDQPNLLVRIIRMLEDLLANLGHSREEINKAREYEATISRVQDALAKAGHEAMIEGERRYSIKRTRTMPYKEQVEGYFNNNGSIRSSDSLYLGDSDPMLSKYGIESSPLYIPTSVINKAIRSIKGSKSGHNLTKSDILELQDGIKNAVAIIYNPSRNALIYVTENQDAEGNYIIATFDLNNDLYGENAHKATSIHGRENLAMMLERLGEDATVFVQNENKLNQMLPGNQILKSLELLAKVELDSASITRNDTEVNRHYSLEEENDPDLQRAIEMQQDGRSINDIFNETGKVVMANGDIYSGIGGVLQYSPNNMRGGDIGGQGEQEAGRAGTYQGRADNQNEAGQGLGEESGGPRNDDRQRNRTDGGRVREEERGWEELSEDERQGFAQIAKRYLQAEPGSELEMMLNVYESADNDAYTNIAKEIYNDLAVHPALVEDRWVHFVPDVQALISDFETAMENTGRRYSLEEDSEGDGLSGALTEEETTTANAMANGMPFEEALKATEDQTLIFILTLIAY